MALMDFIKKQFIDIIQWTETDNVTLAWRFPMADMEIQNGASLTVRESQLALFVDEGRVADQFAPGLFRLNTNTLPVLTYLKNWDKLFESPFKSDVYFFSTRLQIDQKWGTPQPITIRDKDFGAVRLRAFGNYAFRVADPKLFHTEISGTRESYPVADLEGQLRGLVLQNISNAIAASGLPFLDLAANQVMFADALAKELAPHFAKIGLAIESLTVQNVSLPEELQKVLDQKIGMGITGTDVTKNAADMVLADDNFATIVGAVEEGRRVYGNIRKAIQFLLGSNMSEVISIFVATILGFTILKPVHLLWINLVTDCFPALALGMEKAEGDIMRRRPRPAKDGIFAGGMGFDIAYQGVLISVLVLAAYFVGHYIETGVWTITDSADGTTMAFLTMSMAEVCHSFNMRSLRGCIFTMGTKNKALVWAAVGSIAATTLVCEVPFLAEAFGFTPVSFAEYVIAMGIGMLGMVIVEIVKTFQRRAMRKRGEIL